MIHILHCADLHLGAAASSLGAVGEKRRLETLLSFEKIMKTANERQVDLVAISGDLLDSNAIEPRLFRAVLEQIAAYPQIEVVFAAGNHDPLDALSPFRCEALPGNLTVIPCEDSMIEFPKLGLRVYGRSFPSRFLQGEERFTLPVTEDGFLHLMVQHGELKSDLQSEYNAITPEFIRTSGMDYIALGHRHKRTQLALAGSAFYAYCGCPEGQGFDELEEKGVYIISLEKGDCSAEFVPISRRLHLLETVDISDFSTGAAIANGILCFLREKHGGQFADHLYKIELTGTVKPGTTVDADEITERLSEELFFVKVKNKTHVRYDYEALALEKSLKGIFVKKMLARIDAAPEEDKPFFKEALELGLSAFSSEVKFDENL